MSLLKQLRVLGQEANAVTGNTLNLGGCCVFAAAVAERLIAMGVQAECVAPGQFGTNVGSVHGVREQLLRNNLDTRNPVNWDRNGLSFAHVGVRLVHEGKTFVYDSDVLWRGGRSLGLLEYAGGVRTPRWKVLPDGLALQEAQDFANDDFFWNCIFDRSLIPEVRALVQKHLH